LEPDGIIKAVFRNGNGELRRAFLFLPLRLAGTIKEKAAEASNLRFKGEASWVTRCLLGVAGGDPGRPEKRKN